MRKLKNSRIEELKFFGLAALLMAGAAFAACSSSSDEIIGQPENPTAQKVYTMTIKASKGDGATTRALTLDGSTLTPSWAAGEQVTVYNETEGAALEGYLVAQSTGTSTTLSGTLTGTINPNDNLTLKFCSPTYGSQDGTLGYIAANCDYATASVTVSSVDGGNITTTGDADFTNKQAIVMFTFVDKADGTTLLSPSKITASLDIKSTIIGVMRSLIQNGAAAAGVTLPYESEITIPDATYDENGEGVIYLAIPDKLAGSLSSYKSSFDFTLTAIVGDKVYSLTKSGFPFSNGQYYEITAKMAEQVWDGDLSKLTAEMPDAFATATDGMTITGTLGVNKKISIAKGATVTLDGVSINADGTWTSGDYAGITCLGDATIILKDGTTNMVKGFNAGYPGIFVSGDKDDPTNNKTLTIQGTGTLIASSNGWGAGIGGGWEKDCGNIVIESGIITATGDTYAAGIGGGNQGGCGTITISGGTVEANGGYCAAGIGSGSGDAGNCGNITVSGGDVTANGGYCSAGIGSGSEGNCGNITVSGGDVTANGGDGGAGIGSGSGGSCGNITISSGTVEATGGEFAAGIGSGDSGSCDAITISKDVTSVTATKGSENVESIGAGLYGNCGTVTIEDGDKVTQN